MSEKHLCELCGEPMPEGEEMFNYHGYSCDCPKSSLEKRIQNRFDNFFIPIKLETNLLEDKPFVAPKLLYWFLYGDIGLSSETMVNVAVGKEYKNYYPCDPSDFNRCLKLVKEIPEIKNYFDKISQVSPQWKTVIDNWDKLEETFLSEVGHRPSKTHQLMEGLGL